MAATADESGCSLGKCHLFICSLEAARHRTQPDPPLLRRPRSRAVSCELGREVESRLVPLSATTSLALLEECNRCQRYRGGLPRQGPPPGTPSAADRPRPAAPSGARQARRWTAGRTRSGAPPRRPAGRRAALVVMPRALPPAPGPDQPCKQQR